MKRPSWIWTNVGKPADLQSAPFNHSGIDPLVPSGRVLLGPPLPYDANLDLHTTGVFHALRGVVVVLFFFSA